MSDLARLQREFYDRVVDRTAAPDLIGSGDVDIYARMYASRLYDSLADDYPKLRAALGDDRFGDVVREFLAVHRPRSFTMRDAGLGLAEFLRERSLGLGWPAWAADLAALERARIEVFDGPDAEPLTQAEVAGLGEALPDLVLRWVPSSGIVPIAWSVDDTWSAIEDGQPFDEPVPAERVVLAWRRDVAALHRTLDDDEGQLAAQIARGSAFAEVCELLGQLHGDAAGQRAVELLVRWLHAEALDAAPRAAAP